MIIVSIVEIVLIIACKNKAYIKAEKTEKYNLEFDNKFKIL